MRRPRPRMAVLRRRPGINRRSLARVQSDHTEVQQASVLSCYAAFNRGMASPGDRTPLSRKPRRPAGDARGCPGWEDLRTSDDRGQERLQRQYLMESLRSNWIQEG